MTVCLTATTLRGSHRTLTLTLLGVVLSCVGCGRTDGPVRYRLSGKVTFQGQPIPLGKIVFEPDVSAGNDGPGSNAAIKDGMFQCPSDMGPVGGAHVVRIIGFDGKPAPDSETANGRPLFPQYETKANLPKQDSIQNFDVPQK